ncbi:MAG: FmdB family zinc ribbon protein [Chloroflexota bacterium]
MPSYDFRCLDCKRRFVVYISYNEYGEREVRCTHCNSDNVRRWIRRIRFLRSEESRLENLEDFADPDALEGLEDDPRALGRMMRKMGREMGEELGPEFEEVVDRLEAGQSPDEIEEAIPDLGGDEGGFGDDYDF